MPLGPQTGKNDPYYINTLQNKNENISSQGQTSSIPFAYYHFARDKLEDYREAKARAESILMLDENVVHSWDELIFVAVNKAFLLSGWCSVKFKRDDLCVNTSKKTSKSD